MISNLVILAFIVGILTGPIVYGAIVWAKSLKLNMRWWKWMLTAMWYALLLFLVFLSFTFIGEGEPGAGWKVLVFSAVFMLILGAGLVRILLSGRKY